jgi:hypothetical protein
MLSPIFGSHGAESLLRALQPHSPEGSRSFPTEIHVPRFKNKSDLHGWVQELVRQDCPSEIAPGIIVCAAVTWGKSFVRLDETAKRYALKSAAVHAIIATNPEDSSAAAIAEERSEYQYLRLDYDQRQLGPLFKEPAPHIHIVVDGEPRFAACRIQEDLPIADFLDFIFRNYRHAEWARWLHGEWFTRFVENEEDDVFDLINSAYCGPESGSNLIFLTQPKIRRVLAQLRGVLVEQKLLRCPLSVDPELWEVVAA